MKLYLVSTNRHKYKEMSAILKNFGVTLMQKELDLEEPDLGSLEKVAEHKAWQAYRAVHKPVVAEDTGVYFDAYKNFPGVFAKRTYLALGFSGLTALIRGANNKKAHFKTSVSYYDGRTMKTFSGVLRGKLVEKPVSIQKDRMPYEKLFIPNGFKKALVNIPLKEKNMVSHRALATRKLGKWVSRRPKK